MASRASAVLALLGLGIAVTAFALVDALSAAWGCPDRGCAPAPFAAMTVLEILAVIALVGGGLLAGRWLRSTLPRRDAERARR